jgi:hypothetical protein
MIAHVAAAVHHARCVAVANHESNAGAHAPVDHRSKTFWARKSVDPFINPEERGFAMKSDENTKPRSELLVIMQQWKSDVFRGAAAADDASQSLFTWLNDHGQGGLAVGGLTRADLLAVDADELEMFLDDLRDLQEQAEYAVEAMEAVIAAVDENDED